MLLCQYCGVQNKHDRWLHVPHRVSEVLHSPLHRLHAQLAHQSAGGRRGGRGRQAGQLLLQLPGGSGESPLPLGSPTQRRGPGQAHRVRNTLRHGWKIHLCRSKVECVLGDHNLGTSDLSRLIGHDFISSHQWESFFPHKTLSFVICSIMSRVSIKTKQKHCQCL